MLDAPVVRAAVEAAKAEVAGKQSVQPSEVYWRWVQPDDWSSFNGAAQAAGTGVFVYVAGLNTWLMTNVGDTFSKLVLCGWINQGLVGSVTNLQVALNGNRLVDYGEALTDTAENNFLILPDGPKIIDEKCRLSVIATVGAGLAPVAAVPAYPAAIGFPACG